MNNKKVLEQKLKDFEILKSVVNDEIQVENLDENLTRRLISICEERIKIVDEKAEEKQKEVEALEELLDDVEQLLKRF